MSISRQRLLLRMSRQLSALILSLFLYSAYTLAQDVEEVVIEADQYEEQSLNDLVSVSALDAEKLADAGIENVEDVAAYVPNLVLAQTDTGTNIVIRGIGAGVNQGFDQSVGLYLDGVPLPRSQMARAPFLDLSGVQVLRGPQYVLDGNYSLAGSVHMLTNQASEELEVGIDFNYVPSQNDRKLLLTGGAPISDSFGVRFALQAQRADGYVENVVRNEDGPQRDELLARMVLSFNPTDSTSMKLKLESGQFDTIGRQIEIIQSERVPDVFDPDVSSPFISANRAALPSILAPRDLRLLYDFDRVAYPAGVYWDQPYNALYEGAGLLDTPDGFSPELIRARQIERLRFNGRGYLELLGSYYTDPNTLRNPNGPFTLPEGLLDATQNYKRGADTEEFSYNDSINVTFNLEQYIGESKLDFTASYIDYSLEEQIDSDFTALPLIKTVQNEEYDQTFFRLDFATPEGKFIELKMGASYLSSELSFNDNTQPFLSDPLDLASQGRTNVEADLYFNPDFPLDTFLGRATAGSTYSRELRWVTPFRFFDQESTTQAAFLQAKLHWSDVLRTTFGLRYTKSEKDARRELVLLTRDGQKLTQERINEAAALGAEVLNPFGDIMSVAELVSVAQSGYGINFGIQTHSDLYDADFAAIPGVDDRGYLEGALDNNRTEEALLPSFTLEWDASEDLSITASIRKAAKLGGFDARSNATPFQRGGLGSVAGTWEFEDENATSYELGAKWYIPDGRGELYATLFHTEFDDLQISVSDGRAGVNVTNAGAATSTGVELEGQILITDSFNINLSMAWIDFEFTEFDEGPCYFGRQPDSYKILFLDSAFDSNLLQVGQLVDILYPESYVAYNADGVGFPSNDLSDDPDGNVANEVYSGLQYRIPAFCDLAGESNQYVAEWQGTFTLNYEREVISLGIFKPTLDILYNSGYFTTSTLDPDTRQEEYVQLNGRLALSSFEDTWEVAITGQNLTNEAVVSYANELPLATRVMGSKSHYGFIGAPRAIGLNLRYKFY